MISLKEKVNWAVRWGALWDALGLPFETKKLGTIAPALEEALFHPVGMNDRTQKSKKNNNFSGDLEKSGYISDDTILTLAWLQSVINKGKIEIEDLFNEHREFIKRFGTMWFGKGTLKSLSEMASWKNPLEAWQFSRGNGVLMKQFPYALDAYLNPHAPEVMDKKIDTIAQCTHLTPVARLTAVLHNRMLLHLLHQPSDQPLNRDKLLPHLYILAQAYEKNSMYQEWSRDADSSYPVSEIIKKLHDQYIALKADQPYSLQQILDTYTVKGENKKAKYGFHVGSTFGYVYSNFLQKQNRDGLLDTIRIGEDTDTQAAIIGNMIGAYKGEFYDKALLNQLQNKEEIATLLQQLDEKILQPSEAGQR